PAAPAAAPLDARAAATDAPRPAEEHAMELTWTLRRDGDHLAIDYTVHNGGDAQVWVADELLQNTPAGKTMRAVDRLIVRDAAEPDLVSLVRGMTYDSLTTGRERPAPSPAMKAVPAGGEVTGTATVPLPLEAWHNYGKVAPLQGDKRRAVLQLTYVTEPDQARAWRQIPTEDGRKVDGLDPYYLKDHALLVSGAPLPLP
ncbi:MAG: hypothetical protein KC464_30350, partial [Myxococcales bacterium]|nr:hypothetical protein [Myxococcales bacterium]